MFMTHTKARLNEFRQVLKRLKLDAFIIPNADQWQSEHPDACDKRLRFISGLDASAGYAVITADKAVVLIDGRYTLSAKEQVDTSLFDIAYYTDTMPEIWAIEHVGQGGTIGYNPWLHTRKDAKRMQKACNEMGVYLMPVRDNPVDEIWNDRPAQQSYTAINHDLKFAGRTTDEKLNDVADDMDGDSLIITAPDSLAWVLNMRVADNSQAPGICGYGIFQPTEKKLTVFTDVDCTAFDHAQSEHYEVDFLPLDDFPLSIAHFERAEQVVQISDQSPDWFTEHLNSPASEIITCDDPIEMLKAIKNDVEQSGIRASHLRDAIAMKNSINWIKKQKQTTEKNIEIKLIKERQKANLFRGVSFDSIVGWNANGAKIHGNPTDAIVEGDGLLLIDSGAQYDDGTTDITRTIGIGKPTDDMKEKFTLVLKSHIALATAIFPAGTTGTQLDAITRKPLWDNGLDYAHGTGHGVGHFLNVHEGPCGISPRSNAPLIEGMLLSNEPGYYKEGAFGIRHENLMLVQKHDTIDGFLCFETVTFVPFDDTCIIREMMPDRELKWLDWYQEKST